MFYFVKGVIDKGIKIGNSCCRIKVVGEEKIWSRHEKRWVVGQAWEGDWVFLLAAQSKNPDHPSYNWHKPTGLDNHKHG
jgi:hypothetical protein